MRRAVLRAGLRPLRIGAYSALVRPRTLAWLALFLLMTVLLLSLA